MAASFRVAFVVLVVAASAVAQQVHVVAPDGTPGGEFSSVQAAVDAAADGDVVLILPGFYSNWVIIEDRDLVLAGVVGPAGERALLSSVVVRDVAASRSVVVRGLLIAPFLVNDSLTIRQCAGPVLVEDCVVTQGSTWASTPSRIEDSDHVVLTRCSLHGSPGTVNETGLHDGSPALIATRSSVALYDSEVTGGDGGDAFLFTALILATAGGPAVRMEDSTLLLAGCTLTGGQGGDGFASALCLPATDGGDGLVVDGLVRRLDTAVSGGAPGAPKGCVPAPSAGADIVVHGGSVVDIPQTLRRLAISSPIEPGGLVAIDIDGAPSEPVVLLQALAPLGQWLGGLKGTLAGAPPYAVLALGITGADGQLDVSLTVPAGVLPPGLEALQIVDQLVTPAAGGGGLLSSPSGLVLVEEIP